MPGGGGGCDPCSGTPPNGDDLISLGLNENYIHTSDYFFTRIHTRYTAEQATEELMLYNNNLFDQEQNRYIEYKPELEDRFPVCGIGMVDDPGSCDDAPDDDIPDNDIPDNDIPDDDIPDDYDDYTSASNDSNNAISDDANTEADDDFMAQCGGCAAGGDDLILLWGIGLILAVRRRES